MKKGIIVLVGVFLVFTSGCGKKEKAAIVIGDIKIEAEEFQNVLESSPLSWKKDAGPEVFLDRFVSRKLILKEAEDLGLDKDPKFLKDVQLFWEQGLLKLIISQKTKEFTGQITVNDKEVKGYYEKYKEKNFSDKDLTDVYDQVKVLLFKAKQRKAIADWVESLRNKTKVVIDYNLLGIEN